MYSCIDIKYTVNHILALLGWAFFRWSVCLITPVQIFCDITHSLLSHHQYNCTMYHSALHLLCGIHFPLIPCFHSQHNLNVQHLAHMEWWIECMQSKPELCYINHLISQPWQVDRGCPKRTVALVFQCKYCRICGSHKQSKFLLFLFYSRTEDMKNFSFTLCC